MLFSILNFDENVLKAALEIMGKGMLGIFVVMIVLALTVYALTKITGRKNKK